MAQYLLFTASRGKAGREEDFKAWYDGQHLGDMLKIPGVTSARAYDAAPQSPDAAPFDFLAVYELDAEDPDLILAEISRRVKSGEMPVSDAIERGSSTTWIYALR